MPSTDQNKQNRSSAENHSQTAKRIIMTELFKSYNTSYRRSGNDLMKKKKYMETCMLPNTSHLNLCNHQYCEQQMIRTIAVYNHFCVQCRHVNVAWLKFKVISNIK